MEIIQATTEYLGMCPSDEDAMLIHIENGARKCWKSEHRIDHANRSFEKFYTHLLGVGHLSAIEHSNVVIEFELENEDAWNELYYSFLASAGWQTSLFRIIPNVDNLTLTISANLRAWNEFFEKKWGFVLLEDTANFLNEVYPIVFSKLPEYVDAVASLRNEPEAEETFAVIDSGRETIGTVNMRIISSDEQHNNFAYYNEYDIPIYTFNVICDRGITHEIVRHRVLSFSQESTRYVNYAKRGMQLIDFPIPTTLVPEYLEVMGRVEDLYNKLNAAGVKPQFARNVLPNSLKSEIAMSGRMSGWHNFWNLRDSEKAHPSIQSIGQFVGNTFGFSRDA